ncbi:MAG: 2-oxoglutarate dehydrogenase complex dihydrolipoyllysine-residue succinyltransferase [Deltaproteobacteria bacterium]|nr:2-oxoglutarate dehydrogenase complex dihydrolipoyllysine-residue succinyltransferase [Deltaproteobacteria bacterium]
MLLEIKIPSVGESVTEATLGQWYKKNGDFVRKDEPLFVLETDKVTLEIEAEADGVLNITVAEGETVAIGAVVGKIETDAAPEKAVEPEAKEKPREEEVKEAAAEEEESVPEKVVVKEEEKIPEVGKIPAVAEPRKAEKILSPSVRRLVAEKNLDVSKIAGTGPGGRITKGDVILYLEHAAPTAPPAVATPQPAQPHEVTTHPDKHITRKPMSRIRQRIATRLLEAKQSTAMLTTFNEIDMARVKEIRAHHQNAFQKKYGVRLGFMSFFIKACVEALMEFPELNGSIDGKDIVYHNYYHIGVAIGGERGLVVPVIRNADKLSFAELEQAIIDYVTKIQENKLELADLEGGTFTITNGGVFGSLLSTPILNMPQSGILGMHKIEDRPMVVDGKVVVRPMMYLALTYDHRIVDGRQAVTFLVRIKEFIEDPERIMMEV